MKFLFIPIFLLFFSNIIFSQECKEFYLLCGVDTADIWSINSSSKNINIAPGEKADVELEIQKAKDYRISLCGDDFIGNLFHYKIIDSNELVLYNNENDNLLNSFSFSCLETKNVTIVIEIPSSGSATKGCMGVLIEETLSVTTGF
jgi:hypothetical protein